MKALFLSILALLPAAASAQRDTLGVLERSSVFSAEDERAVAGFHTESPAMMLYRSEQSLSQISLRIDLRRCISCFCCQELCPAGAIEVKKPLLRRLIDRG